MFYADNYCTYTEDAKYYYFSGPCMKTKKSYTVKVPKDALYAYRQGAYIQDAMSMLSREDREFLISGYSPEGWNKVFGKEK